MNSSCSKVYSSSDGVSAFWTGLEPKEFATTVEDECDGLGSDVCSG